MHSYFKRMSSCLEKCCFEVCCYQTDYTMSHSLNAIAKSVLGYCQTLDKERKGTIVCNLVPNLELILFLLNDGNQRLHTKFASMQRRISNVSFVICSMICSLYINNGWSTNYWRHLDGIVMNVKSHNEEYKCDVKRMSFNANSLTGAINKTIKKNKI